MQTAYYTTAHFVRHTDNLVDLDAYRRKLSLAEEGSLAPKPQQHPIDQRQQQEPSSHPYLTLCPPLDENSAPRRSQSPSRRSERRGLALELLASIGVVVMTASFTLRILLG